jgi:hypothetical protein
VSNGVLEIMMRKPVLKKIIKCIIIIASDFTPKDY